MDAVRVIRFPIVIVKTTNSVSSREEKSLDRTTNRLQLRIQYHLESRNTAVGCLSENNVMFICEPQGRWIGRSGARRARRKGVVHLQPVKGLGNEVRSRRRSIEHDYKRSPVQLSGSHVSASPRLQGSKEVDHQVDHQARDRDVNNKMTPIWILPRQDARLELGAKCP